MLPDGHLVVYEYLSVEVGGECAEDEEEREEDPGGDECGLGTVGVELDPCDQRDLHQKQQNAHCCRTEPRYLNEEKQSLSYLYCCPTSPPHPTEIPQQTTPFPHKYSARAPPKKFYAQTPRGPLEKF